MYSALVAQLAHEGGLAPGVAPFDASPSTVQRAADAEREHWLGDPNRRSAVAPGDPAARLGDVQRRAVEMVERAASELEQEQKTGTIDATHLTKLQQLFGLVRSAQNMVARAPAPAAGEDEAGDPSRRRRGCWRSSRRRSA